MLQMLVITLREGIEAFLIVAITLAYLKKTGRDALLPAVYWGVGVAVSLSIAIGFALRGAGQTPLAEAILAMIAAVFVTGMMIYMLRAARHMRRNIGERLEAQSRKAGTAAWAGIFLFTVLMITREGFEAAVVIVALAFSTGMADMLSGALIGLACAAAIAWAWSRYGHRVNLVRFFQVTSLFLALFVVQLLIYSFHELTEADVLPLDNEYWHLATEPYGPEGEYGHWLTYSMVILPVAWLAYAWASDRIGPTRTRAASAH